VKIWIVVFWLVMLCSLVCSYHVLEEYINSFLGQSQSSWGIYGDVSQWNGDKGKKGN
jgi:hypothetical protein